MNKAFKTNKHKLILLIITNIAYWSFSEKYIHNGQALDGLIGGVIVSALCVIGGVVFAKSTLSDKLSKS